MIAENCEKIRTLSIWARRSASHFTSCHEDNRREVDIWHILCEMRARLFGSAMGTFVPYSRTRVYSMFALWIQLFIILRCIGTVLHRLLLWDVHAIIVEAIRHAFVHACNGAQELFSMTDFVANVRYRCLPHYDVSSFFMERFCARLYSPGSLLSLQCGRFSFLIRRIMNHRTVHSLLYIRDQGGQNANIARFWRWSVVVSCFGYLIIKNGDDIQKEKQEWKEYSSTLPRRCKCNSDALSLVNVEWQKKYKCWIRSGRYRDGLRSGHKLSYSSRFCLSQFSLAAKR